MKKILSALQSALNKVDTFNDRTPALLAEERELKAKLQTLTAAVGGGDTKSINALAITKARLEMLPDELAAAKTEYDDVLDELRGLIIQLHPALSRIYNETFERTHTSCVKFLEGHLGNSCLVTDIADKVATYSIRLSDLNKYRTVFGGIFHFNQTDESVLISRARYAVENLQPFSEK